MDNNETGRTSNSALIAVIVVLGGLNAIVISSDLADGVRYTVCGLMVVVMLFCVYRLSRSSFKN